MQTRSSDLISDIKSLLKERLSANVYRLWIEPLFMECRDDELIVLAPNSMHREEFLGRHIQVVENVLESLGEKRVQINVGLQEIEEGSEALVGDSKNPYPRQDLPPKKQLATSRSSMQGVVVGELNPNFTFDQFIVGPDNQMAQASCLAVAREPARQFNPLFLYGNTGLGKTHLLQAIYHFITIEHPHLKVLYTNCESFTNEFIEAINSHTLDVFRGLYRQVDVLIVDDIQFLVDKRSTQEEFFHTFNDLISFHKQVIVSSDSSPADLQKFENRLTSRFSSGLVASIDKPLFETRLSIIRHKCSFLDLNLSDEIQQMIAKLSIDNIREINGVLITLNAHAKFNQENINLKFIQNLFPQYQNSPVTERSVIDYDHVVNVISSHFNVRLQDLQSKKRPKSVAYPRQISMYLLRKLTNHSLEEIGAFFGGRDHSTVQYAQMKIEKSRIENSELNSLLNHLEESVIHNYEN